MTEYEYNEIQKRFKNKLFLFPTNKEEEYNKGVRSCMSILHEMYEKQKRNETTAASNNTTIVQSDITYIILETLHECGIYGEEATVKLIGTLKRLGMDDLLPSCAR